MAGGPGGPGQAGDAFGAFAPVQHPPRVRVGGEPPPARLVALTLPGEAAANSCGVVSGWVGAPDVGFASGERG